TILLLPDTTHTDIYTLSLHDALPIFTANGRQHRPVYGGEAIRKEDYGEICRGGGSPVGLRGAVPGQPFPGERDGAGGTDDEKYLEFPSRTTLRRSGCLGQDLLPVSTVLSPVVRAVYVA